MTKYSTELSEMYVQNQGIAQQGSYASMNRTIYISADPTPVNDDNTAHADGPTTFSQRVMMI